MVDVYIDAFGHVECVDICPGDVCDMRPISILNVEGRIFFSLIEKRMSAYMTLNGYIKRWQQKAFIVEVAGCIEHSTLIFEALKEAKENTEAFALLCWILQMLMDL